ncbi:hypothetical protein PISL3812_00254 [Talaromyces islandicus]|uniref:Transcription factor domain-containing protein n=1 Tax=Talaromyces islandicus TaxID=28573 RepID=A0A0U1LIS6_TALIS|nr:hypothetical protein PISL3812_00254 [Talaromyces islandicus]
MHPITVAPDNTSTSESNWPGEREPSSYDVQIANELPSAAFLSDFKAALLASSDAAGNQNLMCLDLQLNEQRKYTYPVALLSDFPQGLPPQSEVIRLRNIFANCYSGHPFLNRLPLPPPSRGSVAPTLPLAIACLASVHANNDPAEAKDLFLATFSLWSSIMEVDNREARSLDLLMTAILICVYGALSSDEAVWDRAGVTQCSAMTIARRMRFLDPRHVEDVFGSPASSHSGTFIWCLWLVDILHALHFDLSVNMFTSSELSTTMPSSSLKFQDVYSTFLYDGTPHFSAPEVTSQDDALLLLMAVLSDLLFLRASLRQIVRSANAELIQFPKYNPFVPLSPHTELERMESVLSLALDRWYETFYTSMPPEIVAFYHYCRMYLSCDQLLNLPRMAGYKPFKSEPNSNIEISISGNAVRQAWLVLDNAAARQKLSSTDTLTPIWLPAMIFHAGLLVWAKQSSGRSQQGGEYESSRVLLAFKIELESMRWPCCVEMAATFDKLMAASMPSRKTVAPPLSLF